MMLPEIDGVSPLQVVPVVSMYCGNTGVRSAHVCITITLQLHFTTFTLQLLHLGDAVAVIFPVKYFVG
jgi:hypothetical protein